MHVFRPHVAAASALLLLAACGGGGSPSDDPSETPGNGPAAEQPGSAPGDGPSTDEMAGDGDSTLSFGMPGFIDPRIEADNWRHDFAATARRITGGPEPTLSSSGHDAKLRQIAADSDAIALLAYYSSPIDDVEGWAQSDPNCSGTTCDFGNPDNPPLTKETLIPPQDSVEILPVMNQNGIEIAISDVEGISSDYGPWDGYSYFAVLEHAVVSFDEQFYDSDVSGLETTSRAAWGDSTGSNPAAGTASWSGVMIGAAQTQTGSTWTDGTLVQGDTEVTVHFGPSTTLDVAFTNIRGLQAGQTFQIDPWKSIPVSDGSYRSGDYFFGDAGQRYLDGKFFGPTAEETAGVFWDDRSSDATVSLQGAFGAVRDEMTELPSGGGQAPAQQSLADARTAAMSAADMARAAYDAAAQELASVASQQDADPAAFAALRQATQDARAAYDAAKTASDAANAAQTVGQAQAHQRTAEAALEEAMAAQAEAVRLADVVMVAAVDAPQRSRPPAPPRVVSADPAFDREFSLRLDQMLNAADAGSIALAQCADNFCSSPGAGADTSPIDGLASASPTLTAVALSRQSSPVPSYSPAGTHEDITFGIGRAEATQFGNEVSVLQWGAWMEHGAFLVTMRTTTADIPFGGEHVTVAAGAYAFGDAPAPVRVGLHEIVPNPSGSDLVWNGAMVGADISDTVRRGRALSGNAKIMIRALANPTVDVTFSSIVDETGATRSDVGFQGIPLGRNTFNSPAGVGRARQSVAGVFLGPNHEEVAGTFAVRDEMIGAYGGARTH